MILDMAASLSANKLRKLLKILIFLIGVGFIPRCCLQTKSPAILLSEA